MNDQTYTMLMNHKASGMYFKVHYPYRNEIRQVQRPRHPSPYVAPTNPPRVMKPSARDHGFRKNTSRIDEFPTNMQQIGRWARRQFRKMYPNSNAEYCPQPREQEEEKTSGCSLAVKVHQLRRLRNRIKRLPESILHRFKSKSTTASTCSSDSASDYDKAVKRTKTGRVGKKVPLPKRSAFLTAKKRMLEREVVPWIAEMKAVKRHKTSLDLAVENITSELESISLENMLGELPDAPPLEDWELVDHLKAESTESLEDDHYDEMLMDSFEEMSEPIIAAVPAATNWAAMGHVEHPPPILFSPEPTSAGPVTPPAAVITNKVNPFLHSPLRFSPPATAIESPTATSAPSLHLVRSPSFEQPAPPFEPVVPARPCLLAQPTPLVPETICTHSTVEGAVDDESTHVESIPAQAAAALLPGLRRALNKCLPPSSSAAVVATPMNLMMTESSEKPADIQSMTSPPNGASVKHTDNKFLPPPSVRAVLARPMMLEMTTPREETDAPRLQRRSSSSKSTEPRKALGAASRFYEEAFDGGLGSPPAKINAETPFKEDRSFSRKRASAQGLNPRNGAASNKDMSPPTQKVKSARLPAVEVQGFTTEEAAAVNDIAELWKQPPSIELAKPEWGPQKQLNYFQRAETKKAFRNLWKTNPVVFETLIGMQLQSGRNPLEMMNEKLGQEITEHLDSLEFVIDTKRIDRMAASHGYDSHPKGFYRPECVRGDVTTLGNAYDVYQNVLSRVITNVKLFDDAISEWALENDEQLRLFTTIIDRAGWVPAENDEYWQDVKEVKLLADGKEKDKKYQALLERQPRTVSFMWDKLDDDV